MFHNKKKGFTIVELVIVIAVIAVLAAVLIPTFAGLINKANMSVDQQAVAQLNKILAAEVTDKPETLAEVEAIFAENGFTLKGYTPLTSGHKFVWDKKENKIMFVDKDNKVVYPEEYAGKTVAAEVSILAASGTFTVVEESDKIVDAVSKGGVVKLPTGDVAMTATNTMSISTKDTTVELNGANITVVNEAEGAGVFQSKSGTLTINGDGVVDSSAKNTLNMAVVAMGGNVVINGGTYTNKNVADADPNDNAKCYALIYAHKDSNIVINGGTFICCTPAWTLNLKDDTNNMITVKGGEFWNFNPADETNNDGRSFVPEGYVSVPEVREDGTWYVVKPASEVNA